MVGSQRIRDEKGKVVTPIGNPPGVALEIIDLDMQLTPCPQAIHFVPVFAGIYFGLYAG